MTITVGTNSYVALADATAYFTESLGGDSWNNLDPTVQEVALVTAARMIDRQTWAGIQSSSPQTMQWPRSGVTDRYGNAVDSSSVPQQIKDAQCELALALQQDPSVQTVKDTTNNVKRVKAGSAEVEFMRPVTGGRFPVVIQELIGQFLGSSGSISSTYATGTCETSKFDPCDPCNNYNLNGGFS